LVTTPSIGKPGRFGPSTVFITGALSELGEVQAGFGPKAASAPNASAIGNHFDI